ncbi:MAG: SpoIIIAH-like family protein [Clostridia bacterium]|nr:SpoIIIAH-like family protein [Clostridia bacterium]
MSKKKKIVLLSVMVALLVVSGVMNFMLNNTSAPVVDDSDALSASSFFSAYRTDRTATREQTMLELDAIISSEDTSESAKIAAEEMKLKLCANMQTEFDLEALIKAKGFSEAVVSIGTQNINVLVNDATLESAEVAQILSIIVEETGVSASNVKITPYGA